MSTVRSVILALILTLTLAACSTAPPDGVRPVTSFDIDRYLGRWYEIARLDHSFERGMSDVSATYQLQDDGSVKVINRGYDTQRQAWKEAIGRAVFIGDSHTASLKVSFFGPFYGGYHVIALDQQSYRWALVAGPDRDYLWILARDKTLPADIREQLVSQARRLGFATDQLIWVEQKRTDTD
ncbi:MAG: lipocalin family protein [Propionivibrio sp.]|nr:lipocalin family protein [Propionivibrio sp.]